MSFFSRVFKSSPEPTYSSSSYDSSEQFQKDFNIGLETNSSYKEDDDDYGYDPCFEIVFWKELSNNTIIFQIIDDDYDPAGHIVVTKSGETEILESGLCNFDDEDRDYLRQRVKRFCEAAKIGKS